MRSGDEHADQPGDCGGEMEVRKITENRFEKRETLALFTQRDAFKIHLKSTDIKDRNSFVFVAGFSLLNKHSLDQL